MLKNIMITLVLLCAYLCLLILFKHTGIEDKFNLIISSFVLGTAMKSFIHHNIYVVFVVILLTLLFALMNDLMSIPYMMVSIILSSLIVHFIQMHKLLYVPIERHPKNPNREFLND